MNPFLLSLATLVELGRLLFRRAVHLHRWLGALASLLGLILLAAEPASAGWHEGKEVVSGSTAVVEQITLKNKPLRAERAREKLSLACDLAPGSPVAARGTTTLYRSVSAAEHADIAASGALRAGPNSFSTGKWFWESAESAARFGSKMDGPGNFRIIEATFPRSAADQFMRLERLDG